VSATTRSGRIAAVVALLAVLLIVFLILTGGSDPYRVTAKFENASQLVKGNEVVVGGTSVGSIDSIELGDNGEAEVTFHVSDEYAPLPGGTHATVRSFSLSGIANRQIELNIPAEAQGEPIADGGTLEQSQTTSAVDLDQLFNTLDDETVADLKKVIRGFELSYQGVAKQANRGAKYFNPFLSTSRRLFAELTRDERSLERLIVDGSQLSGALAERRDDVSALVGNLNQTMGAIGRQRDSLAAAVAGLPDFMRNFNTTAVNLRSALDDVDPLVDASKPVAVRLRPWFGELRRASANLVPTVRDLDRIVRHPGADNDLVDLMRLQVPLARIAAGPVRRNGARRAGAFPEAVRALDNSLPQLAFFRAYTPELAGWFDDFGHSGILDANGGIGRIGTTFNTFSVSPLSGLPDILDPLTPEEQKNLLDLNNTRRCPGANERRAADGSWIYTEGGELDCDPSQVPPGR
jgi:phospholipid/cholesterol/gamma-HCH transport system substrate-binding protein